MTTESDESEVTLSLPRADVAWLAGLAAQRATGSSAAAFKAGEVAYKLQTAVDADAREVTDA